MRKNENYFQNSIQAEGGLGFIGAGLIHEFIYREKRDFFVSPYGFGIFEFMDKLYFYPGVYFDIVKNQFYPEFSISISPGKFNILTVFYEKRTFFTLVPEIYDSLLPLFTFKNSLSGLRSFKNELNFIYEGRWFEKIYIKLNYDWGVYDSITLFIKDSVWEPVVFEHIKINKFRGTLKYEFSKLKFRLSCFYLYSDKIKDYWKNKVVLKMGYEFKNVKPLIEFIYPFRFKKPVWNLRVYFFPSKNFYLNLFFRWINKGIRYYNNYTLNSEVGIGIGLKED